MKKLPILLIFLGIAVLVAAILININISNAILNMNGFNGMSKASVTAKNKTPALLFSSRDIENLEEELETEEIGYYALTNAAIEKDNRNYYTKVYGVNPYYKNFVNIDMVSGSLFSYKGEELKYVVVLDANLALEIFNSTDVVGQEVKLYDKDFEVVGVYEKYKILDDRSNENIIERLSSDGLSSIYIPANTLMEIDKGILIDTIFIKTDTEILVGENENMVSDALYSIGKWAPNYVISDFNKNMTMLKQKPEIILLIIGIITVLLIVSYIKRTLVNTFRTIRAMTVSNYLSDIISGNKRLLAIQLIKTLVGLLLVVVVILAVRFDLYIPQEYLHDDLIDTKYYEDLIDSKIYEYNQELNVLKSHTQLEYEISEKLTNVLFFLAIIIGIPGFHIGIYQFFQGNTQVTRVAVLSSCFFVASIILAILLSAMMGLPYQVKLKSICVIWGYISTSVVYTYIRLHSSPTYRGQRLLKTQIKKAALVEEGYHAL